MLVVSRRPGQSILIGRDIEVYVLEVDGMQVRVGINAPRSIRVLRRELLTQVESENRRAVVDGNGVGSAVEALPDLAQQLRHPEVRAS
jgi:carbon storage regulator